MQTCLDERKVARFVFCVFIFTAVFGADCDGLAMYCALQVVIYEALMLLKGRCQDTGVDGDDVASSSSKAAALKFIEAVANTKSLDRPKYINLTFASHQHRC